MADERSAGVAARVDVDVTDADARFLRRAQREPDRPDLRVGEDHARRSPAVRAQLDLPAEDRVGDEPALVLAHVRELDAAVDVADGVHPVVTRHAQVVADLERLAGLDSECLEADPRGARRATDGDEQLVGLDGRAVVELER